MTQQDSKVVGVRVTLDEYALLKAMAKTFKMSVSHLIHEMLSIGFEIAQGPASKVLNDDKEGQ